MIAPWKRDPQYRLFYRNLKSRDWTFESTVDRIKILDYVVFSDGYDIVSIKDKWCKLINNWNAKTELYCHNTTYGFVACVYLLICLPFDDIKNIDIFSEFFISCLNIAMFYNNHPYLKYSGAINILDNSPPYSKGFGKWIHDEYELSLWWITYWIYENLYSLGHIIKAPPTRKLSNKELIDLKLID
jgi:hypothetical protein